MAKITLIRALALLRRLHAPTDSDRATNYPLHRVRYKFTHKVGEFVHGRILCKRLVRTRIDGAAGGSEAFKLCVLVLTRSVSLASPILHMLILGCPVCWSSVGCCALVVMTRNRGNLTSRSTWPRAPGMIPPGHRTYRTHIRGRSKPAKFELRLR